MKSQSKITLTIKSVAVSALLALAAHMNAAPIFVADFNGTGGGTGGVSDIVTSGGTGTLIQYTTAITTVPSSPTMGQGNFINVADFGNGITTPTNGNLGAAIMTPTSAANSFQAMNTVSGGAVSLHGAVDFFLRNDIIAGNVGTLIDVGSQNGGGIRLIIQQNNTSNGLRFRLFSGGAGTEGFLTGPTYTTADSNAIVDAPFTPTVGATYHFGFTMITDGGTGVSTLNVFSRIDTLAIDTSSTADRIGTLNFKVNGTNVTSGLAAGTFFFNVGGGASPTNGAGRAVSADALRLYDSVPAEFAAIPEPGTVGLIGLGTMGLLIAARRRKA